jgi:endonuclease YncB( thermonuclease family)
MTDLNKSNNKNTDIDVNNDIDTGIAAKQALNSTDGSVHSQQVSIKAWSQKLLVVILCVASFYGGWKSYESNMVNECTANGGQMIEGQRTMLCQSL